MPKTRSHENRARNIDLRKSRRSFNVTEKNRRTKKTFPRWNPTRLPERCAVSLCLLDETLNLLQPLRGRNRAHVGAPVQRVTDAQCLHVPAQVGEHFLIDA